MTVRGTTRAAAVETTGIVAVAIGDPTIRPPAGAVTEMVAIIDVIA
jgi:hypothetical protein